MAGDVNNFRSLERFHKNIGGSLLLAMSNQTKCILFLVTANRQKKKKKKKKKNKGRSIVGLAQKNLI